jgi:beta-phosphoglucomutase family hydrolase
LKEQARHAKQSGMANWAAIFDWDGVIVDSSRQHAESWELLARQTGHALPPGHFERSFGMTGKRIFAEILKWPGDVAEYALLKEKFYRDIVAETGIEPLPGVREFLGGLHQAGISCAIGSSTPRENIDFVLKIVKLGDHFSHIVAGEDVPHGKPDPEVFLLCARRLGFAPNRCVVFEDAHVGIQAARAAGMKVVGVATTHPAESLREADRVVRRLDELSIDDF